VGDESTDVEAHIMHGVGVGRGGFAGGTHDVLGILSIDENEGTRVELSLWKMSMG
jgi:hypothetical protein